LFLRTIDEKVSIAGLKAIQKLRIFLVVPADPKGGFPVDPEERNAAIAAGDGFTAPSPH
jgi:hypothetical protein